MKMMHFTIPDEDIDAFKKACNETTGITFLDCFAGEVSILYKDELNLYHLGRMTQLHKLLSDYETN